MIALVDAQSLEVKVGYNHTPFGTLLVSSLDDYNAVDNALLFAGRELDVLGTLLYYMRGRYYSADLHRFISEDPIGFSGGDTNLYRYVGNAPHVGNDPTGLYSCFEGCGPSFEPNASDSSGNVIATGRRFNLNIAASRTDDDGGASVPDEGVPGDLIAQAKSYRGNGACNNITFAQVNCSESLSQEQAAKLKSFRKSLPKDAGEVRTYNLPNGGKAFQATVPARNIPGSYTIYEKQVSALGETLNFTLTTIAPNGAVVKVAPKFPGGVPLIYPQAKP